MLLKPLLLISLFGTLSLPCLADLLINEFAATNSDHLLVRESGEYPRVGNTIPWQSAEFDDSAWQTGDGPFGFGIASADHRLAFQRDPHIQLHSPKPLAHGRHRLSDLGF